MPVETMFVAFSRRQIAKLSSPGAQWWVTCSDYWENFAEARFD